MIIEAGQFLRDQCRDDLALFSELIDQVALLGFDRAQGSLDPLQLLGKKSAENEAISAQFQCQGRPFQQLSGMGGAAPRHSQSLRRRSSDVCEAFLMAASQAYVVTYVYSK